MQNIEFRIEKQLGLIAKKTPVGDVAEERHREVMEVLSEIRAAMKEAPAEAAAAAPVVAVDALAEYRKDLEEAARLKIELDTISKAIMRTKEELVKLQDPSHSSEDLTRMTDELSAIVQGTEKATETILGASEIIDENAGNLAASLQDESQQNMAADIQDNVVKIFGACNFQDLTGQRITKVVKAFQFIETHVDRMLEIWTAIESFRELDVEAVKETDQNKALLNGPSLDTDEGTVDQDDIDALFA